MRNQFCKKLVKLVCPKLLVIALCLPLISMTSFGKNISTAQGVKQNLSLVGEARLSILFWDIYHSKLYAPEGRYHPEQSFYFEITYLRDIKQADLIQHTIEQWQHLGFNEADYRRYVTELEKLWPNLADGDQLAMSVTKDKTSFYFNQQYIGKIDGGAFGKMFSDIWLSKNTSRPELRRKLLGMAKANLSY
ncbi:chalcone isomerase family protein [Colwellia sp. MEBiC06753]